MGKRYYQGDTKWAKTPYPKLPYTVMGSGCGPTACASIIYDIKPEVTPKETAAYMLKHNYAIAGSGTTWAGITACLKNFGFKNVYTPNISTSMRPAWDILNNGNKGGILLFRGTKHGGTTNFWTTGGHYVAFDNYKYENGKHWFHTLDPAARNHTGWYAYETTMKGSLPKIWIVHIPKFYPEELPGKILRKGMRGPEVRKWQKFLKWYGYTQIVGSSKLALFGTNCLKNTKDFQRKHGLVVDGIPGPKTYAKARIVEKGK